MASTNTLSLNEPTSRFIQAYWDLMKPRVMSLVIFTAFVGIFCAPKENVHVALSGISLLFIALGAGGSAVLNMWYENRLDSLMDRTKNRPIPQGVINEREALIFGSMLSVSSVFLMAFLIGYLPAFLLAFTIYFYAYFYTILLKPHSSQNIVWGGIAGALPPVIGWFCVTSAFSWIPLYLFGLIFLWTVPHFWALSIHFTADYKKVNIPMLPVVKGIPYTKHKIFIYSIITILFSFLPYAITQKGAVNAAITSILSFKFLKIAWQIKKNQKQPLALFRYSIFYLFALFLIIMVHVKLY
jgi:protoheme IX farnesyltransferase